MDSKVAANQSRVTYTPVLKQSAPAASVSARFEGAQAVAPQAPPKKIVLLVVPTSGPMVILRDRTPVTVKPNSGLAPQFKGTGLTENQINTLTQAGASPHQVKWALKQPGATAEKLTKFAHLAMERGLTFHGLLKLSNDRKNLYDALAFLEKGEAADIAEFAKTGISLEDGLRFVRAGYNIKQINAFTKVGGTVELAKLAKQFEGMGFTLEQTLTLAKAGADPARIKSIRGQEGGTPERVTRFAATALDHGLTFSQLSGISKNGTKLKETLEFLKQSKPADIAKFAKTYTEIDEAQQFAKLGFGLTQITAFKEIGGTLGLARQFKLQGDDPKASISTLRGWQR